MGRPLSRSYGTKLPSSLERVISRALACSACPPVSVYSTITCNNTQSFSRQCGLTHYPRNRGDHNPISVMSYPPASLWLTYRWYRNINRFTIAYASYPGLSLEIDLPWADEPSPGNLRLSADGISTRLFVTYADILTSISCSLTHVRPST